MSGSLNASCCCEQPPPPPLPRLWYAIKCPDFFEDYCCQSDCGAAPNRIDFCESYLTSIGISLPPDITNLCYYIAYDCCVYILTGYETVAVCPPVIPTNPIDVGRLLKISNKAITGDPCCYPEPQVKTDPGQIIKLPGANIEIPSDPCEELVAQCYTLADQVGTSVPVTVSSSATQCIETIGVTWPVRCDHGPPVEHDNLTIGMVQNLSLCTVNDFPAPCPTNYSVTQYFLKYMDCPDCDPEGDCCGSTPNCDVDPDFCSSFEDRFETYNYTTCYSVNLCDGQDHVEDVLHLTFDACFAPDIVFGSPTAQAELNEMFITGEYPVVEVTTGPVNTGWGVFTVPYVRVCDLTTIMFSGNAAHIAAKVNSRIGALVQASGIGPWSAFFWFGFRQSCFACPEASPNERPPASFGDTIYVDRVAFINGGAQIRVWLRASSPRWYVCASQRLRSDYSTVGDVINCAISAVGTEYPYVLKCLSFPEYSNNFRYTMRRVEEPSSNTSICTDINFYETVAGCQSRVGWPLNNIVVGSTVVQVGWRNLCPGQFEPKSWCYSYPFQYTPALCCPPGEDCEQWNIDHPLPQPCLRSFQSTSYRCTTDGSVIAIT